MSIIDWIIVAVPLALVMYTAQRAGKQIHGVVDFLSAGRVCGRYVISVADAATGLGVITLVATVEINYRTGFAMTFWNGVLPPLLIFLSLTGFCFYRFRETRSMSIGQFIELRYNRKLRIFAASLRSISEMLANMICPAVAARFFIYYLGLPHTVSILGFSVPTFILVVLILLTLSISIICFGGTLSLIITDTLQGLICYPILVIFVIYVLNAFSWSGEIVPVLMDRVPGESFINPYDIENLRDFNIALLVVVCFNGIYNYASWIGAGNTSAGKSPHEQKMAGVLGAWRTGFSSVFCVLMALMLITLFTHPDYAPQAKELRDQISRQVTMELVSDVEKRNATIAKLESIPEQKHEINLDAPLSQERNLDTVYLETFHDSVGHTPEGNYQFQQFRTLYHQMMLPMTLRHTLPVGLIGLFGLLMVMMMISTDDSRIFSSALTITQDVIMPLRSKPFDPRTHIRVLRLVSIGVGIFFFLGSFFMAQLDYINLFIMMMCSVWLGGAGAVMIFGLYSRFGTTAGAFTALIGSTVLALGGILLQRNWADYVYPFLDQQGWVDNVGWMLETLSAPLNPYVVWTINPVKFPINSVEYSMIVMVSCIILYCVVSLLTCRKPFPLERMLHREKSDGTAPEIRKAKWTPRRILSALIGITPEYTTGDKVIALSVFLYSLVWMFLFAFVGVILWNIFSPRSKEWWGDYFLVVTLIVPGIAAALSTVWFTIGGYVDLRRLFHDLAARKVDTRDDGWVENNQSISDSGENPS